MQTSGDLPARHTKAPMGSEGDVPPMIDTVLDRVGDSLRPVRMEPPLASDGLRPISFADGLDELSVDAIRRNGGQVHSTRGVGEEDVLKAAARRADQLGLQR